MMKILKNTFKFSYATSKTMKNLGADLGVSSTLIFNWKKIYTDTGDKTKSAEQQDSLKQHQIKNVEHNMENKMLKKGRGLLCKKPEVKYRFIQEQNGAYSFTRWVAMLDFQLVRTTIS